MSTIQNAMGKMTNYRWTICAMLFFATTVNYLDRQVLSLTWDEFIKPEFHWDESHYGTITSVFSIVYAICMLFAGRFVDWMGTKKGFLWAIGVWSLGACLHAVCGIVTEHVVGLHSAAELAAATGTVVVTIATVSMYCFLAARCVLALGEAGNFPAAIKVTAEYFPKKDRAYATSIFNAGASIGALIAPLTIPVLAKFWGWEMAFIVIGALGFIWMGFWVFMYTPPAKSKHVNKAELEYIEQDKHEVGGTYVEEKNEKKMVCVDPNDIPAIAIVDAELMYTLPRGLTAATGIDALTHAIEGLITKGAWEMSDMFEIKAIDMINRYLPTAVNEPSNAEARNGMAVAQYIAGMAFSNVGLGAVHGMAHPLGAIFDIPHGVANALLLPIVMEFNMPAAIEKYGEIAKAMGVYKQGMTPDEAAQAAVDAVRELAVRVGIPQHLAELGIKEEDLPRLAEAAMADVCTPGNPRDVTYDDILALYKKAY